MGHPASAALLAWAGAMALTAAAAAPLTPQEEAGRALYLQGAGGAGAAVTARVGAADSVVPGSAVPCANCHGEDRLGRPEGAVRPPAITWGELTKPYGHEHDYGRRHPPFDEGSLLRAVTRGVDPAGNRLDPAMPRYELSQKDAANLLAYLKRAEAERDPGLSEDAVRIGTLLPAAGPMGPAGQAMGQVLAAYFEALNARGGVFGRRVELVVAPYGADRAATLAEAEKLLREQDVFALVAPFAAGIEADLARLADAAGVPVVGPFTLFPENADTVGRYSFHLLPGLRDQGRALARFAARELGVPGSRVATVYPEGPDHGAIAEAAAAQFASGQGPLQLAYPAAAFDAADLAARLRRAEIKAVLFFGAEGELAGLAKALAQAGWTPHLLASGARAGRVALGLPAAFAGRLFLAYPTLPEDVTPRGAAAFGALQQRHGLPARHQPAQLATFAAAALLEEGLKQAGRQASRARFIDALENVSGFESGVMPALGFGPGRHTGAAGAHIVAVDLAARRFRPTGKYVRVD